MIKFFKQDPLHIEKIWGGSKLAPEHSGLEPIGESWQVACLPEGSSTISGEALWDKYGSAGGLNFLIKLIDTSDNLSVQVHPDDLLAEEFENSRGKTECWYILDSEKDAKIYLGLKPNVSMSDFQKAIENQENVQSLMNCIEALKGRFVYVPAGLVHAIGSGVTLIEVQQSSGITYRLWDWNRVGVDLSLIHI